MLMGSFGTPCTGILKQWPNANVIHYATITTKGSFSNEVMKVQEVLAGERGLTYGSMGVINLILWLFHIMCCRNISEMGRLGGR